jgi:DNA-binding transcriptional MocR family regulator
MDAARMGEVYALARKWSLVIIEDDAYYWLQYPQGPDNVPGLNLRREFSCVDCMHMHMHSQRSRLLCHLLRCNSLRACCRAGHLLHTPHS